MEKKYDILYVDDEQDNLDVFESTFWKEYNLHLATSPKQALAILEKHKIHLIVTDQRMPEITGVELLEEVVKKYPEIERMILTGYSDADSIMDAINKGKVFQFVAKPWSKEDLKQSLNNALESFQLKEENQLMLQKLQLSNKKLEDFNHGLETTVEERTKEITEQNIKLSESVSQLKEVQTQLVQSEKLASLGMLSAALGHEIKNPIAIIKQSLEMIKDTVDDSKGVLNSLKALDESQLTAFEQIKGNYDSKQLADLQSRVPKLIDYSLDGVTRIVETVNSIRDFVGGNEENFLSASIHQGIDSTLNLLNHRIISAKVSVVKSFDPLVKNIKCLPSSLNQVFMNLFVNAIDAIEEQGIRNGRISIETKVIGNSIKIQVEDNGSGIPSNSISHIFQEFYTTKPSGKGIGLGLAIVKGIIDKHGGVINVESRSSEGTLFTIELPIDQE